MKYLKKFLIGVVLLVILFALALVVYSANPYQAEDAMIHQLGVDLSMTVTDDFDQISYTVDHPISNIIIIPGGKVKANAYQYLAYQLALENHNVTIVKPLLNLAILTPNYANRFIDEDLDNVLIGHSLGGVVAAMIASKSEFVSKVVLLGSYSTVNINDIDVLLITGEFDLVLDQENFTENQKYLNEDAVFFEIEGGNHAQFGWYGPQKGDGVATISTLEQQNIIIEQINMFITN
ncbi:MAG: alpha/beta hydrolase [Firmicutes bacterium]|nr:alpha/beta hydrolase [Bacillota bacterium]